MFHDQRLCARLVDIEPCEEKENAVGNADTRSVRVETMPASEERWRTTLWRRRGLVRLTEWRIRRTARRHGLICTVVEQPGVRGSLVCVTLLGAQASIDRARRDMDGMLRVESY